MQIIEIKNNLVKIGYDSVQEQLILSGFLVIKDESQSFVSQIMHLEANANHNFAIVKLIFNFDSTGTVTNYNGSIPNMKSEIELINSQEILELLPIENPVVMGELAQQNTVLKLDRAIFENKLLVCSEKAEPNKILIQNISAQLENAGKKLLVFDTLGDLDFSQNKIVAGEDFKLPLNYDSINFIYERGLDNANPESKALIQEVFLEVQNYVKTIEDKFIPFELFKNVVDEQYKELGLVELVLLKNKLLKYHEAGIFAQEKSEFLSLETSLNQSGTTIFDLSKMDEKIQREIISYAYSQIKENVYVVVNVDNKNSDKKLLKQIFMNKAAYSTVICPYSYKYLTELKQLSKNVVLFPPIQQQNDFASYNIFLNKLNSDEFVVYGSTTQHVPFIVQLSNLPQLKFEEPAVAVEPQAEEASPVLEINEMPDGGQFIEVPISSLQTEEELLDEKIRKDVDQFYTTPKTQEPEINREEDLFEVEEITESDLAQEGLVEEDLTEDDLDLIEENLEDGSHLIDLNEPQTQELQEQQELPPEETLEIPEGILIEEEENNLTDEEFIQESQSFIQEEVSPEADILPASVASAPIVPIYSADVEPLEGASSDSFEQGDTVVHAKYGKGVVEKLISYGTKTLCSINFDNVGRRLLDPTLAEIKKS